MKVLIWYQTVPISVISQLRTYQTKWLAVSCREQFYTCHCYAALATGQAELGVGRAYEKSTYWEQLCVTNHLVYTLGIQF